MQFLPGDTTTIFSFSRVEREKGCMAKYGFVYTRGILFFVAEDGFYALGAPQPPIGNHIVDEWFRNNSDPARRDQTYCFPDPRNPHIMWAFYSSNTSDFYDRVLIFDWMLNRLTYSTQAAQMWGTLASPSVDLDTDIAGDALDPLLDSTAAIARQHGLFQGGRPVIAASMSMASWVFSTARRLRRPSTLRRRIYRPACARL